MRFSAGFTLIELLITIAIAAVVLSLGAPAFLDSIARNRLETSAGQLVATLNFARSEAIKRAQVVTVCSRTPTFVCGGDDDWDAGWMVMATGDLTPLRLVDALRDVQLDSNGAAAVAFAANGTSVGAGDTELCLSGKADTVRVVRISPIGMVSSETRNACPS